MERPQAVRTRTGRRVAALGSLAGVVLLLAAVAGPAQAAPGDLDLTFSGDGKQTTDFGFGIAAASATVRQPDGKILVVGASLAGSQTFALARYNTNGSLDTSFSGDGKQTTDFGEINEFASGVALQGDGKIVVVGGAGANFAVARYNTNGSLDTSFSGDGRQTTAIGGGGQATGVAIQADGRIVAVGSVGFGSNRNFGLARYNTNGSLDTSFSGDGKQTTDFGGDDQVAAVALQADGKIVAVGRSWGASAGDFALARYNPNGSLDPSFSGDGKHRTSFRDFDGANGVAIQGNGKIVAVGTAIDSGGGNGDFALARYNSNGTLDTSFSGDGKQTTDFGGGDEANGVALQADGKIVAAGRTATGVDDDFALARYNPNGSLDTSFSGDGKQTTDFGATDGASGVALQADGKIVAVGCRCGGEDSSSFAVARYNPNGTLDTSFSGDGRQTTEFGGDDEANGVALQADGKIVAVGQTDSLDFSVARYNSNGTLDTSFSGDGKQTTDFGGFEQANGVALQADGKIVVVGFTAGGPDGGDFALARYNSNGTLDTSFSGDGKQTTEFSDSDPADDRATGVALQADGKIVAVGRTGGTAGEFSLFALARYNANGSLDTSFSGDGKLVTGFGDSLGFDGASGVALQADGKIVAAGVDNGNFAVARYNTNGSLDTGFSGDGKQTTDFGGSDGASGVALQADGRIVAVGSTTAGSTFALARYNTNGTLDTSFSGDGKQTTEFGGDDRATGVALQADGKIVAAGQATGGATGIDFALARYNTDGSLDAGFSGDGKRRTNFGGSDQAAGVAIQADGKIVAAGGGLGTDLTSDFALARYLGG